MCSYKRLLAYLRQWLCNFRQVLTSLIFPFLWGDPARVVLTVNASLPVGFPGELTAREDWSRLQKLIKNYLRLALVEFAGPVSWGVGLPGTTRGDYACVPQVWPSVMPFQSVFTRVTRRSGTRRAWLGGGECFGFQPTQGGRVDWRSFWQLVACTVCMRCCRAGVTLLVSLLSEIEWSCLFFLNWIKFSDWSCGDAYLCVWCVVGVC